MNTNDQNKVEQLSKNDLNGIQKAALLLIALNVETASQVFKYLEPTDVEAISAEISKVKNIPSNIVEQVIDDYHDLVTAREYVLEGGLDYAQQVLEKSFGLSKAMEVIDNMYNDVVLKYKGSHNADPGAGGTTKIDFSKMTVDEATKVFLQTKLYEEKWTN